MIESFSQNSDSQARDSERVDRVHEKHKGFLEVTFNHLQTYLAKEYKNFKNLSSGDKNKVVNSFLIQEFPDASNDFRTKLKVELLARL